MTRAMVVDDDAGVREMICAQLEAVDIEATPAANGRVALELLCRATVERVSYDIMILDIMMPQVDGWQVLKAVKNNPLWEAIPIVVVSGHADTPTDIVRIIDYDGVYVEKRAGFAETVGTFVTRILADV